MKAESNENTNEINNSDSEMKRFIRCPECGEPIQMVPVLADMITAIENHLTTHQEPSLNNSADFSLRETCIRDDLTGQVLRKAAESLEIPSQDPATYID